jgi:hypothetical protein
MMAKALSLWVISVVGSDFDWSNRGLLIVLYIVQLYSTCIPLLFCIGCESLTSIPVCRERVLRALLHQVKSSPIALVLVLSIQGAEEVQHHP